MPRRSTPQHIIDERAFPVRLLICVPRDGFSVQMTPMHDWLNRQVGRTNHAIHGAGVHARVGRDAIAVYFRHPSPAAAFLAAFPEFDLADGTVMPGYTSPYLPVGRPPEDENVCNLYNQTTAQEAMRQLFHDVPFEDRGAMSRQGITTPTSWRRSCGMASAAMTWSRRAGACRRPNSC